MEFYKEREKVRKSFIWMGGGGGGRGGGGGEAGRGAARKFHFLKHEIFSGWISFIFSSLGLKVLFLEI